jgi:GT2 family glycosyltransferase
MPRNVTTQLPHVTAVVLAYGDEPWVERCVRALLASRGVGVDVVLVDNGCTTGAPDRLDGHRGVRVLRPGRNLGFAGGCNLGAEYATGEVLALVNADALVAPDALARLAAVALCPEVGLASGSIRLADDPSRLNSAGNPVHFTGLSWAGAFGEPADLHDRLVDVASASGAGLALRRALWEELGGFSPEYFAYHEDTELSLRCWQRGLRVVFVPDAVVVHRYEFSRNAQKSYLLERNRLLLVTTLYERRTLLRLLPALVLVEFCLLAMAVSQGWGGAKARGWCWLLQHRRWVLARRAQLQAERLVKDEAVLPRLSGRLTMANLDAPPGLVLVDGVLAAYWSVLGRLPGDGST